MKRLEVRRTRNLNKVPLSIAGTDANALDEGRQVLPLLPSNSEELLVTFDDVDMPVSFRRQGPSKMTRSAQYGCIGHHVPPRFCTAIQMLALRSATFFTNWTLGGSTPLHCARCGRGSGHEGSSGVDVLRPLGL